MPMKYEQLIIYSGELLELLLLCTSTCTCGYFLPKNIQCGFRIGRYGMVS